MTNCIKEFKAALGKQGKAEVKKLNDLAGSTYARSGDESIALAAGDLLDELYQQRDALVVAVKKAIPDFNAELALPDVKPIEQAKAEPTVKDSLKVEQEDAVEAIKTSALTPIEKLTTIAAVNKGEIAPKDVQDIVGETKKQVEKPTEIPQKAELTGDEKPVSDVAANEKIDDLGEKIGGARKDTAKATGQKNKKTDADNVPAWRKRYVVIQNILHGKDGKWNLFDKRTGIPLRGSNYKPMEFDTEAEAEKMLPMVAIAVKHRVRSAGDGKFSIFKNVGDKKSVRITPEEFDTYDAGMKYMAEHAAELLEVKQNFGEEVLPTPENVYRYGAVRRNGDVVGDDFLNTFGFRGVEFGNWNNQEERQEVMNHAYDALLDMAEIINVPPKAISLNGDLALAFGARGQGLTGAKAHYEPDYAVINLTKMSGAGSLAHEWLHSLDHYLSRLDGAASSEKVDDGSGNKIFKLPKAKHPMASHGFLYKSNARPEVTEAFSDLIKIMFKKAATYVEDTKKADDYVGKAREELRRKLDALGKDLAEQKDPTWYKRNNKPAKPEQIIRYTELADSLLNGEIQERTLRGNENKRSRFGSFRDSNDIMDEMSAIYKAVRGREGFKADKNGVMDRISPYVGAYYDRVKMLKDADAGTEKTRAVPTDFYMQARAADQARTDSYWSSEHEMAARAFAAYVEDKLKAKDAGNDFLAYKAHGAVMVPVYPDGFFRPYPEGEEREAVNAAFDKFFGVIKTKETDKGVMLFSKYSHKPGGKAKGITKAQADQAIADFEKELANPEKIDIIAAPTKASIMDAESLSKYGADQVRGYYVDRTQDKGGGAIVLVLEDLDSVDDAMQTLRHEWIAHHGLNTFKPADKKKIINRLLASRTEKPLAAAWKHVDENYADETQDKQAEELLAYIAEKPQTRFSKLWNDLVLLVEQALKALGWMGKTRTTKAEINQFIVDLTARVSQGAKQQTFGGEAAYSKTETDEIGDTFYSQMQRVLDAKLPGSGTNIQMKQAIEAYAKKGEFKQDELEWSGVNEWLGSQLGKKITKQEVLDFLKANQIQVQEVVKSKKDVSSLWSKSGHSMGAYKVHVNQHSNGKWNVWDIKELKNYGPFESENAAKSFAETEFKLKPPKYDNTKFKKYQLPGGENYRELLLTLSVIGAEPGTLKSSTGDEVLDYDGNPVPVMINNDVYRTQNFKSSHYDELNILAHVRFNERVDADGKRVLFLEEIQSDWHQQGRKKGYDTKEKAQEIDNIFKKYGIDQSKNGHMYELQQEMKKRGLNENKNSRLDSFINQEYEIVRSYSHIKNRTPDAPFKTTWPMLAMKRMIRYASENGFEKIAWTTGKQQAERYDLSKQIGELAYWKDGDGYYGLSAVDTDYKMIDALNATIVKEEDLESTVGKDIAQKIVNDEGDSESITGFPDEKDVKYLRGDDLKIGGEGMKGFYDVILPKEVNKYVKKWGASVGESTFFHKIDENGRDFEAHSVEITPAMKKAALAGQPMFSKKKALPANLPNILKPQEQGMTVDEGEDFDPAILKKQAGGLPEPGSPDAVKVISESRQIKSAIGNRGTFDAGNPDIRYSKRRILDEVEKHSKGSGAIVKQWLRRNFTKEGLTNESTFESGLVMDAEKNVGEHELAFMVSQFEKDLSDAYSMKYNKIAATDLADVNDYLSGNKAANIPQGLAPKLDHLRAYLDRLSGGMLVAMTDMLKIEGNKLSEKESAAFGMYLSGVEGGYLPASVAKHFNLHQKISDNKGTYLTRSYQAHDDKAWKMKALNNADLMKRATDYFKQEYPDLSQAEIEGEIKSILQRAQDSGNFVDHMTAGAKQGSKDTSLLMKKKDVPPIIRELLGEYKDPKLNFVRSATKMQWYVANHNFLMSVRENGLGTFLFEKPTGEYHVPVATESSEAMNPLNGLYTSEEFRQGLIDASGVETATEIGKLIIRANSIIKYGKTLLAPATQARNFLSAGLFTTMNGHFDWRHTQKAWKGMKSDLFTHDQSMNNYLRELIGLGVLHNNPFSGELKAAIKDFSKLDIYRKSPFQKGRLLLDFVQRSYQAGDDFWKIVGYENELALQVKSGIPLAEAKKAAAYRIRNGYPTYSMVPRGIKKLRRWWLIGTFVSFPYEIIRTSHNNVQFLAQDIKAGRKQAAAQRFVGMATVAGLSYGLSVASMIAMGMDDDDDEAFRKLLPPWSRNSMLIYTGFDKNGAPTYYDMSYIDPYTYIKKPISALMNGNNKTVMDKLGDASWEFAEPFLGIDIGAGIVKDLISNKKDAGGPVYNEEAGGWEKAKDILNHTRKALQPGIASNVERIVAAVNEETSRGGKKYVLSDELLALVGQRFGTLNIPQSIVYKSFEFGERKARSSMIMTYVAGSGERISDSEMESATEQMLEARTKVYEDMIDYIVAAKAVGMNEDDLAELLEVAGISSDDVDYMLEGEIPAWEMPNEFGEKGLTRAMLTAYDDERRQELEDEHDRRMEIIEEIMDKQ